MPAAPRLTRPALLAALSALAACAFMDPPPPEPPTASPDALRAQLTRIMAEEGIPGAAMGLLLPDGTEWTALLGYADLETRRPVTADTPFRAGSITKTVLGLGLLQLVEEGRLDLGAPVRTLLPDVAFTNAWEASQPLRLVHLLEHASGFDDSHPREFLQDGAPAPPLAEVLALAPVTRTSRWEPGTRHAYSNPGYTMAGLLLERLTGKPFEAHLADRVLRPAGMTHATLAPSGDVLARLARGYVGSARLVPVDFQPILHRPAGALVATLPDVLALARLFVAEGRVGGAPVFAPALLARLQRTTTLPVDLPVGFGIGIQRWQQDGWLLAGHSGNVDGFSALWAHVPGQATGLAVLTNANNLYGGMDRLVSALVGFALRGRTPPAQSTVTLDPRRVERLTGFYNGACPRTVMLHFVDHLLGWRRVVQRDGKLLLEGFARTPRRLLPVGPDRFRVEGDDGVAGLAVAPGGMLFSGSRCFQRTDELPRLAERWFVFGNLPVATVPVFLPLTWVWRRRRGRVPAVLPSTLPPFVGGLAMLGCLLLLATIKGLYQFSPPVNARTLGFFVLPVVFAAAEVTGVLLAARALRRDPVHRAWHAWALGTCVIGAAAALYMVHWDQVGFALWAF
ncbi:MAG: beta-lactamase family protein [Deltaproteobacteria bacterium]|nr:beta-lactamase family protein [Deltaproteobacteria bacterium]